MTSPMVACPVVFPAYAGVIPVDETILKALASVPRVCGGDPDDISKVFLNLECSPRKRG